MKKGLIILFALGLLAACTSTSEKDIDGSAGASLKREDTISQYETLKEKIDIVANNPDASPEDFAAAQEEVREFQKYLDEYKDSASPGASKYMDDFSDEFEEHEIFDLNRRSEN